ncbi:MAG TPA: hypothetical protein DCM14_01170 [Clostridiales bacterium UBA8153]|nr:hypothetical protein [Clostridiales bacterium UBA8153]
MRQRSGQVMLVVIFAVLGFMVTTQIRNQQRLVGMLPLRRADELTALLRAAEAERDLLRYELASLRVRLEEVAASESAAIAALNRELASLRLLSGVSAVRGPGILVTMHDSQRPRTRQQDPNVFLIHDDDLLKVVNELRAAGAEAISINGQRLTALSEIRCVGPTISINSVRVAPPIVIAAVGDAQTMEGALKMRGGVVDQLSLWGIEVTMTRERELLVPAYDRVLSWKHARPAEVRGTP